MDYRRYQDDRYLRHLVSVPFIWAPFVVFVLLDIVASIYHAICFPLYGLEKVKREEYIQIMDRGRLQYLTGLEKLDCMYCGYANGLLLYVKEIAGRTEKYWCGIMHQNKAGFKAHVDQIQNNFIAYGDAASLEEISVPEKSQSGARETGKA